MDWLPQSAAISVSPDSVKIIHSPDEFYNTLIEKSSLASKRICISSLYLGDGELEKKLVSALDTRLSEVSDLSVTVLLDFLRGTRGTMKEQSSTTLLKRIADRAIVSLFHTPQLSGFLKRALPERTNEIVGLQHMKLYIFDDSVLISGANLSDSYFTNRQDRYVLFENCEELADLFCAVVDAVARSSFVLNPDVTTRLHPDCQVHPFLGDPSSYSSMVRGRLDEALSKYRKAPSTQPGDTLVYPLLQMGIFGIHEEFQLLKRLFAIQDPSVSIHLASGYLNCIDEYNDLIMRNGKYTLDALTAAPLANGFYGASGVSGYIPAMYSHLAGRFLALAQAAGRGEEVRLREWHKQDWTFHAKGIWVEGGDRTATLLGSSNYGFRSVHRDLEAQVLLVTSNPQLRQRLQEERRRLFELSSPLDASALKRMDHHVPTLVRAISRIIRNFF